MSLSVGGRDKENKQAKVFVAKLGNKVVIGEAGKEEAKGKEKDLLTKQLEEYKEKIKEHYERLLENIKEKAYKEGYDRGYKEGYKKAYEDASPQLENVISQLKEQLMNLLRDIKTFAAALDDMSEGMQKEIENIKDRISAELLLLLPDLIGEITYKLADKSLQVDEEFLRGYVSKAISQLKASEVIEIRAPEELYEKVVAVADKILETDINIRKIVVNVDTHIDSGIIADSKLGLVDARLQSAIDEIKGVIKEVVGYHAQRILEGNRDEAKRD